MDYIRIFDRNATNFESNGKAVLEKASDVHVTREINGDYALNFKYPIHDAKMKHIQPESICRYEGQLFRIRIINQGEVSAKAIYLDAARKHLQYVEDMIGETPYNIMVRLFRDTPVHIMTDAEVEAKGMQWVTDKTDFFEISKISPIGALQTLTEQLEKQKAVCELYVDNYNIALVRRLGSDNAGRITLRFNAKNTTSELNSTAMVTRLYAYGMDDLDFSSVNGGKQYIDSPYIDTYGVIEGFTEFDDCEDPAELLKLAKWRFADDNIERIDVPKYNMEVNYAEVQGAYYRRRLKPLRLGDRVKIRDEQTGVETIQRIIKTDIYPLDPSKSTIEVGQPKVTFDSFLGGIKASTTCYNASVNDRNQTKTSSLEMMRYNKRVSINNALKNQKISLYKTGALFESPDGSCAVAVINGVLAIAAGKTNGEWDWTTVIDDNQVLVSEVFTGALYTNMCTVLSDNGKLTIEDSLITMKDEKDVVRFECGYKDGKYVFCLYNAMGQKTIYMGDDGEVYFAGNINTKGECVFGKDCTIGNSTESISQLKFKGMLNESYIENNDTDKVFKIVPSYCKNNLVFDMDGIKIDDEKIATEKDIASLEDRIAILERKLKTM